MPVYKDEKRTGRCIQGGTLSQNVKRLSNTMSLLMNYNKVLSKAISPAFLCLFEHPSPWTIPMVVAMIYRVR